MKKIFLILLLLVSFTLLVSCEQEVEVQKYYKTQEVQTGSINSSNSYSTYTQGITETTLSAQVGGKTLSVNKEKGDRVSFGEILAVVDSAEAQVGYQTSNNIISSLYSLKNSISNSYNAQIQALNESLKKAEENVKGIVTTKINTQNTNSSEIKIYENKLQEAEISLDLLNKTLDQTQNVLDGKRNQIYKNATNAITSSLILDTSVINFVDELLGITPENKDKNDSFDEYLGAFDTNNLKLTTSHFNTTYETYKEYKNFYETYIENKNPSDEKVIEGLNMGNSLASDLKELLKNTNTVLETSIDNLALSQEKLNGYKQQIYNFGNNIEASIITVNGEYSLGLKGSLDGMDSFNRSSQKDITLLKQQIGLGEKQVEIAKSNLEKIKNINSSSLDTIDTNKQISTLSINEIKASIQSVEKEKQAKLKEIDVQINEATGNRNMGSVQISNNQVVSAFDGIIVEKYGEIGQVVGAGTPIYKIANDDIIKLNVNINRQVVQNITIGGSVEVEIEGTTKHYTGTISNIPSTQDEESKNTEIEITINNSNHEILIGSSAKVYFSSDSQTGIIVPNQAIISNFMIPGIMTVTDSVAHLKNITIVKQNDNFSLVEGLDMGEVIIVEGQENIWDGEELFKK